MLIIVFGLPGSGKTFFASALSEDLKCKHLNTDILRKEYPGEIDYSEAGRSKIYEKMLSLSEEAFHKKEDLILDGTFIKRDWREKFKQAAISHQEEIHFIEIKAEEEEILKRVSKKRANTDADVEVYRRLKKEMEPMEEKHLTLRSDTMDLQDMIHEAKIFLGRS